MQLQVLSCRLHNQSGKEHCRKKNKTRNIAVFIFGKEKEKLCWNYNDNGYTFC
jgi:hypothetical protein